MALHYIAQFGISGLLICFLAFQVSVVSTTYIKNRMGMINKRLLFRIFRLVQ